MNKNLKNVNKEDVLFFTIDTTTNSKELESGSKEYELFKAKMEASEESFDEKGLNTLWEDKAPLKLMFSRISTISIGFSKGEDFRVKTLKGSEEDILLQFADISSKFGLICGWNALGFSLPTIVANSNKYFDVVEEFSDAFNPSGKKPWEIKSVIDLTEVVKGTYWGSPTLEEACHFYGIETNLLDGADVSKYFWNGREKDVYENSKNKLVALYELFSAVRWDKHEFNVIDASTTKEEKISVEDVLRMIANTNSFSPKMKESLAKHLSTKKLTKKDKENLFTIIRGAWVQTDFINMNQDSKKGILEKEEEIKEFIKEL